VDSATALAIFRQVVDDVRTALQGGRWSEARPSVPSSGSRVNVEFVQTGERLAANLVVDLLHLRQENIDRVSHLGLKYQLAIFMNAPDRGRKPPRPPR
jgi:hypothetical protein